MNKGAYRLFYCILLGLFLVRCFNNEMVLGEIVASKVVVFVLVAAALSVVSVMSGTIKAIVAISVCAALGGTWIVGGDNIREWISAYIQTCWSFDAISYDIPLSYEYAQLVLVTFGVFMLAVLFEKITVIKYVGALAILGFLIYSMVNEQEMDSVGVAMAISLMLTVVVEAIQKNWKKRCQSDIQEYIVRLVPFIAIYMLVLMFTPHSDKPYDWKYTKKVYERICDSLDKFQYNFGKGGTENYVTSMAGFSDSNMFFGNVSEDGSIIMKVNSDANLVTNLYLIGRSYDSFYGNGWQQVRQETSRDRIIDTVESLYAVKVFDKTNSNDYMNRARVSVEFGNYHSKYTFMPLKTFEYSEAEKNLFAGDNVLEGKKRGYGDGYSFAFYQMNMDSEPFDTMLEEAKADDEAMWKALWGSYKVYGFSLEDKMAYDRQLMQDYSQEISLSDEMKLWVDTVTAGATTKIERLKKLEQALSEFEYNTAPEALPEEVRTAEQFLDYFVLNSRSGYCTYYATAFALLARSEGFATRYVEGFCVPITKKNVSVTGNMAHAWPEVYIEGYGWVPFEPTPGYRALRYTPWDNSNKNNNAESAKEWYLQMQQMREEQRRQEEATEEKQPEPEQKSHISVDTQILVYRLIAIILISLDMVLILVLLVIKIYYSRLSFEGKYQYIVNDNFRMLSFIGIRRSSDETLEEFGARVNMTMEQLNSEKLMFYADYENVRYGQYDISQEWFDHALKENEYLKKNLPKLYFGLRKQMHRVTTEEDVV